MTTGPLDPRTHARSADPWTSHAAAERLAKKTTMLRRLLYAYAARPMTAEEAAEYCGYSAEDGAWKRSSDLAARGLIEDTDTARPGRSGRLQIVRRITDEGLNAL